MDCGILAGSLVGEHCSAESEGHEFRRVPHRSRPSSLPGVGKHRLDRLDPEHLERLYKAMVANGSRPATAHQVHRTIRTALGEASRHGHVSRNAAALAKPPRVQPEHIRPYSVDEIRLILAAHENRPNSARWAIALALGVRQGEVLGLRWDDVDLDAGLLGFGPRDCDRFMPMGAVEAVPGVRGSVRSAYGSIPRRVRRSLRPAIA